jgi:hypothetical protein
VRYRTAAKEVGAKAFILKEHLSDILCILSPELTQGPS